MQAVAEAANTQAVVELVPPCAPDVFLMDHRTT